MSYRDFKDLPKVTAANQVLRDKACNIANNPKHDGYPRGLPSMVSNFFDKEKFMVVLLKVKLCQTKNYPRKRKIHSSFIDNIYRANLADMKLIMQVMLSKNFLLKRAAIQIKYG